MALTESKKNIKLTLYFDPKTDELEAWGTLESCCQIQRDGEDAFQHFSQEKITAEKAKRLIANSRIKEMEEEQ